ncbi:predicted protein [Naegleria gruberi]|uniref:Predicted protein n=1 Tax=Naegleria gruberi TaxID=5762 RepID=D2VE93_NAEGR|nr:uncharacterized protein NAEGRDRAFT_67196 [Naegleria gruberi]EFC44756.1 predicted protein [Naegleria gruberi]|eukprot:XP_002677500.1 predicted protein [Naegleria gruberi strain NEG-M]
MDLKQLYNFARCNSRTFKVFFNVDKRDIGKEKNEMRDEKDLDFNRVQVLVWKLLAVSYFPRVDHNLNVKNWMQFLRKRMKHIKGNGYDFKLDIPSFVNSNMDEEIIENCEWVYKCPLSYFNLSGDEIDVKFCNVCEKHVYLVDSLESFRERVGRGNCVAFTSKLYLYDEPLMGECVADIDYDTIPFDIQEN